MTSSSNDTVTTLRIELEGIEPLIWRRFAVRTAITLANLHKIIQAAMGWDDCHLWMFTANDHRYGILIPGDDDWNNRIKNADGTTLGIILSGGLKELSYAYDFGDGWQHRIFAEGSKPAAQQTVYPQFLGGERRCPPEDCGGIPGYYEFLERISAKSSKKRKAALDWYGGLYDPYDIDEQQIIRKFKKNDILSGRGPLKLGLTFFCRKSSSMVPVVAQNSERSRTSGDFRATAIPSWA